MTSQEVYDLARRHGFGDGDAMAIVGIAATESDNNPGSIQRGGKGRGLIQIDLGQHPDVTEAQALDPDWSMEWLKRNGGPNKVTFYGPRDNPQKAQAAKQSVKSSGGGGGFNPLDPTSALNDLTGGLLKDTSNTIADQVVGPLISALGKLVAGLFPKGFATRGAYVVGGLALMIGGATLAFPKATAPLVKAGKAAAAGAVLA